MTKPTATELPERKHFEVNRCSNGWMVGYYEGVHFKKIAKFYQRESLDRFLALPECPTCAYTADDLARIPTPTAPSAEARAGMLVSQIEETLKERFLPTERARVVDLVTQALATPQPTLQSARECGLCDSTNLKFCADCFDKPTKRARARSDECERLVNERETLRIELEKLKTQSTLQSADDYVAWCTYTYNEEGGIQTIVTCDSDAKGAFKVYRAPVGPPLQQALDCVRQRAVAYKKLAMEAEGNMEMERCSSAALALDMLTYELSALGVSGEKTGGWLPIESAPKDGRTLLLGFTRAKHWRIVRGQWFSKEAIGEWEDSEDFDAGWYETAVENDEPPNCWATTPSHWMPLPPPPKDVNREQ